MSQRRWWYAVGVGTATFAGFVALAVSPVGDAIGGSRLGNAIGVVGLLAWLGTPVAIYLDLRTVRDEVAWDPSTWPWVLASLFWFVNVIVGATYVVRRASAADGDVPSRRWLAVLVGCLGFLGVVVLLEIVPDWGVIPEAVWDVLVTGWLVGTGVLPAAVYLDAERVAGYTDWDPRRPLWVLGAGVPFLNVLVGLRYVGRRREAVDEADAPDTLTQEPTAADSNSDGGASHFTWAVAVFGVHLLALLVLALATPSISEFGFAIVGLVTWPPFGVPFAVLMRRDMRATADRGVEYGLTRYLYLAAALVQGAAFWSLLARAVKVEGADLSEPSAGAGTDGDEDQGTDADEAPGANGTDDPGTDGDEKPGTDEREHPGTDAER